MRHASRRSWCIGQTQPVRIVFISYRRSLQADPSSRWLGSSRSRWAVEDEAETVEEAFATARDAEAQELWSLPHFVSHSANPVASSRRCLRLIRLSSLLLIYRSEMDAQWMSLAAVQPSNVTHRLLGVGFPQNHLGG